MWATLLAGRWRLIAELVVIGILLIWIGAVTISKNHYKAKAVKIESEYEGFKLKVAQLGEAAEADKKRKDAENADRIKKAERDASDARGKLAQWVSESGTRGRGVPDSASPATGACPEGLVCFDGSQLDAALRSYRQRVSGLIGEGSEAVIDRQELTEGWPK